MTFYRLTFGSRLASPAAVLVVGLVVALMLILTPPCRVAPVKEAAAILLEPGQLGVRSLRKLSSRLTEWAKTHLHTAAKLTDAQHELRRLREENRRLADELTGLRKWRSHGEEDSIDKPADRLLKARCVSARVLGQQARTFLVRQHLLDVGSEAGVQAEAPVVDMRPLLIDCGSDASVQSGQLVLHQGRVWGKVVEVGSYTSAVRTLTEPGYRDLVRLASPNADPDASGKGPCGILEGTGESLARIRLIEVTEPVVVGDLVYNVAGKGVLPRPLLCGRVVRVERPVGAAHWGIWMEPVVDAGQPDRVAVLRVELNPLRLAEKKQIVGRVEGRDPRGTN